MQASAAYNGYFKYGEWLPVWVELENQSGDVEGEVRIQVSGSQGITVFAAPVSLPAGSRKSFPIYVLPNNFSRELQVNLISQEKVLVSQKVSVRPQPNISYFIGMVSPERGALGLLNSVKLPGQERPKVVVDVSLAELPERVEGLRSFDTLILNNVDTSQITPQQASTLQDWVQLGGRLVLGGGSGAQQLFSGLSQTLLPVQLAGTVEIDTEAAQSLSQFAGGSEIRVPGPYVVAVGQPAGGQILAGSENLVLVSERTVGSGAVDFVAFDLTAAPFNGWPGTQTFWETLLGPGAVYPENMPFDVSVRQMRANSLQYALSNIPALDLPSIQGLSLLLVIYILIVGPVNYLILRWRQQMHLAWVTIPVITVLFTAGAFSIGYLMRGNDLILNKVSLVEVQPGGSASVTSFLGLFSPRQQSYEIAVEGEGLASPMSNYDSGPWGPNTGTVAGTSEMAFIQGEPTVIRGLTVNQFSMQSFMSEDTWNNFGELAADLQMKGDVLTGTVRNETAYKLTDVVVAFQSRFVRLGDLTPGQEVQVDLGLGSLQSDRFGPPLSYRLYLEPTSGGSIPRSAELKSNIVSSVIDNDMGGFKGMLDSRMPVPTGMGTSEGNRSVLILGWLDQSPPEVTVKNNRLSQQTTALVFSALDFHLPDKGPLSLPLGMIPGDLTQIPSDGGTCGPTGTASIHMGTGTAEFAFQLPKEVIGAQIRSLKLNLWRDSGGDWGTPEIAIWDWSSNAWVAIQEPIQGINVIQDANAYVNENGQVKVRLTSNSNIYACNYLDMGLEADRPTESGGLP